MKRFNSCQQILAQDLLPLCTVMKRVQFALLDFILRKDIFPEGCYKHQLSLSIANVSLQTCFLTGLIIL